MQELQRCTGVCKVCFRCVVVHRVWDCCVMPGRASDCAKHPLRAARGVGMHSRLVCSLAGPMRPNPMRSKMARTSLSRPLVIVLHTHLQVPRIPAEHTAVCAEAGTSDSARHRTPSSHSAAADRAPVAGIASRRA